MPAKQYKGDKKKSKEKNWAVFFSYINYLTGNNESKQMREMKHQYISFSPKHVQNIPYQ